ncbi:hypothetical protein EV421DRAFT_1739390 [Armillaria borealis]|uniref:Uncharacterized protein n=1 Tax=Armillaria borealis TaxID=47425 RepID=A0AA39J754_9AGAR|nr:hypothetical protein EV421DRAFT_1739390 [Armillaria borealis]
MNATYDSEKTREEVPNINVVHRAIFTSDTNKYGHRWSLCSPTAYHGTSYLLPSTILLQKLVADGLRGLTGGGRWCWDDVFAVSLDTKLWIARILGEYAGESTGCVYARIERAIAVLNDEKCVWAGSSRANDHPRTIVCDEPEGKLRELNEPFHRRK